MFSYYALSGAFVLSAMNYFLLGWNLPVGRCPLLLSKVLLTIALQIDGYYEHSFEIWLACSVVFPGAGNLGFTMLEYRLGSRSLLDAVAENLTWIPFLSVPVTCPSFMPLTSPLTASSSSEVSVSICLKRFSHTCFHTTSLGAQPRRK